MAEGARVRADDLRRAVEDAATLVRLAGEARFAAMRSGRDRIAVAERSYARVPSPSAPIG